MNQHTPIRTGGSLLERASETFDFRKALADVAPVAVPAPAPRPEPAPARDPEPELRAPEPAPEPEILDLVVEAPEPVVVTKPVAPARFGGRYARIDRERLREAGLIVPDAPATALSEEFRIVKRQLLLEAFGVESGKPLPRGRMILVASAQPNDGKTYCATNLALSMAAEKDLEILLVDGDFAKPEIVSALGLDNGPGLLDVLADASLDVENCIIRTDIPGFSVLPSGRHTHSDTELLAAARTKTVLEALLAANPQRVVIFDSPPALAASPASVLALHAGQAVVVVKADKTSEAELRDAIGLLSGCDTIQLLLNAATYAGGRSFGSYYGYGE